jgi:hypothetical protein
MKVTREMTEAGLRVLYNSGMVEHEAPGADAIVLTKIFHSMMLARDSDTHRQAETVQQGSVHG